MCKDCWDRAYITSIGSGKSQVDEYYNEMRRAEEQRLPCTHPMVILVRPIGAVLMRVAEVAMAG